MPDIDIDIAQRLTDLAVEAGPFFFAILVLVYLARRAGADYREVHERIKPRRAAPEEIAARRRIYYANWAVGFLLVLLAAGWWLYSRSVPEAPVVFQFAISGLSDQDQLRPTDDITYARIVTNYTGGDSAPPKTYYFLRMSSKRVADRNVIQISFTCLDPDDRVDGIIDVGPDANGQRLSIEREQGRIKKIGDDRVSVKRMGPIAADTLRSPEENVLRLTRMDGRRGWQQPWRGDQKRVLTRVEEAPLISRADWRSTTETSAPTP
jgi:hypothetical protein